VVHAYGMPIDLTHAHRFSKLGCCLLC